MINFSEFYSNLKESRGKEILDENILALDKDVRRFDATKERMSPEEQIKEVENILHKYASKIKDASSKFVKLLQKYQRGSKGDTKILHNVKPVSSVISKVVHRKRDFKALGDLVRGAILFETQEELDAFVKDFKRKESNIILDYEAKEKGGDKVYGYYGSHHFDLDIDGFVVELQAMTKKLWKFKDAAHKIYNKSRDAGVVTKHDIELSKQIFNLGNRPKYIKEAVESGADYIDIDATNSLNESKLDLEEYVVNINDKVLLDKTSDGEYFMSIFTKDNWSLPVKLTNEELKNLKDLIV